MVNDWARENGYGGWELQNTLWTRFLAGRCDDGGMVRWQNGLTELCVGKEKNK
jgi:hypothetical protein